MKQRGLFLTLATIGLTAAVGCAPAAPSPAAPPKAAASPAAKAAEAKPAAKAAEKAGLNPEIQRLIAEAKAKGETQLNISYEEDNMGGAEGTRLAEQWFKDVYDLPIRINFTPGPSRDQAVARMIQEVTAGQKPYTDVINLSPQHFGQFLKADVLEKYDWAKMLPQAQGLIEAQNSGVQVNSRAVVLVYNTRLIPEAQAPTKLADVFRPEWKGKLVATPTCALCDTVAYHPNWGPEKFTDYLKQLSQWIGGLARGGEAGERVAAGEFHMLVFGSGPHDVRPLIAKGAPLGYKIPEDAATINFTVAGLPKNAVSPNLAKLFINLQVAERGQRLFFETMTLDHHELPGSQTAKEFEALRAKNVPVFNAGVQFEIDHPEKADLRDGFTRILRSGVPS